MWSLNVNLENHTGKFWSLTNIYTSMILISSQFLVLMRNAEIKMSRQHMHHGESEGKL